MIGCEAVVFVPAWSTRGQVWTTAATENSAVNPSQRPISLFRSAAILLTSNLEPVEPLMLSEPGLVKSFVVSAHISVDRHSEVSARLAQEPWKSEGFPYLPWLHELHTVIGMRARVTLSSAAGVAFLSVLSFAAACGGSDENRFAVKSELITQADSPFAMAFSPDGRLFYVEYLTGNVRLITSDGDLQQEPFATVEAASVVEWGTTGLALDPEFKSNRYVYVYFSEWVDKTAVIARPVVVRFTDENNRGIDRKVIVGDLPETTPAHAGYNANGKIHFGPDGFLYLTVGDYDEATPAQDLSTPKGKLLRVNKEDGSPAPGNPFVNEPNADPRIFAYGFRETFDFAFHPRTGRIYGTDNTPVSCEELNIVEAGGNYGWPTDVGQFPFSDCKSGSTKKGIHFFAQDKIHPEDFLSPPVVLGIGFASGDVYPLIGDSLLICELGTGILRRLALGGPEFAQVERDDVVVKDCAQTVAVSPDGLIYYANRTEIRRLDPQPIETKK